MGRRGARILAQSMMLAEEGLPKMTGKMAISVGVLAAILVVWAGFIEIDDKIRVGGQVIPAAETRTVFHPECGNGCVGSMKRPEATDPDKSGEEVLGEANG